VRRGAAFVIELRTKRRLWYARYRRAAREAGHRAALRSIGGAAVRSVQRRLEPALCAPLLLEKWLYTRGLRSARDLRLPHFLGIGVEKAGTTWLYENLRHHPDIYMPAKELRYFDRYFHRPLRTYAAHFAPGVAKIRGDITPTYCVLPLARIQFIRRVMPEVRIILMLRDPVERAWSYGVMHLLRNPGRRLEETDDAELYAHFRSERSRARGSYPWILDRWHSVFPSEQVHIALFENIARAPDDVLRGILAHIGASVDISFDTFPLRRVVNPGPGIPLPDRYRRFLEELYREDIEALCAWYGPAVAAWRRPWTPP
jgi:Sulfotransferase family